MSEKDCIIGAITNYNWDKIKYWVNSVNQSGFSGDKIILVFNCNKETVEKLISLDVKILSFQKDQSGNCYYESPRPWAIVVERFFYYWQYINSLPENYYRYVIATDVKDVIFQSNPSVWLTENLKNSDLVASSESLLYKDEPWGADNLQGSYPFIYNNLANEPIWNCGVQAGTQKALKDLWLNIYLLCKSAGRMNPDQAAYNMLLNSYAYKKITKFVSSEHGWACQAGTTVDPTKISNFRNKLLDPEPLMKDGMVFTSTGLLYPIVHQWDRVSTWHQEIERRYG